MDTQDVFRAFLALVGKEIRVGLHATSADTGKAPGVSGTILSGTVVNAMFDSFLLATSSGTKVVGFSQLAFVDEL